MEILDVEIVEEGEAKCIDSTKNSIVRFKILHHFIKKKISMSLMETILVIPGELESLENLVKLAREKCDEGLKTINLTKMEGSRVVRRIIINKNHRSKTLHLLVEINNNLIKGLVDTSTFMSIMSATIVKELIIMHLVSGLKCYKIASSVVTQAFGIISELHGQVGDVHCMMNFMVVGIDNYDILLELNFHIKMGGIVDVEKGMIQIK